MVDAELGRDLMSFGVPVLVLGDPAQLPPVQGGGFFTDVEPDAMLTEVHRQAAGRSDRAALDAGAQRRAAGARRIRPDPAWCGAPTSIRSARSRPTRSWSAATRRGAPTTGGMRERRGFDDPLPLDRRQAGLPAQQPPQGPVQRRAVERRREAEDAAADPAAASEGGRGFRRQGREGLGASRMLHRQDRRARLAGSARNTTSSTSAMC